MAIEKLHPSFTFTEDRLAELRAVVPEAFADGAVNWETLREALGGYVEDEGHDVEHFGLTWPGKRQARRLAAQASKGTLVPAVGEGVSEATTRNLFIEGDNLEVLKLLQKSYAGRVKLIYIDPPYNTGNDFIYEDDFSEPLEDYLRKTGQMDESGELLVTNTRTGGRFHSKWLSMMFPRLLLARQLLNDEGVIFVSIADQEIHHLRGVLDEVFGEENFVATIIWQKNYAPKSSAKHFSEDHDYILVYAKNGEFWRPELLPRTEKQDSIYKNSDHDPRGLWRPNNLAARNYYSKGTYSIKCPGGRIIPGPPKGSYWRVSEEKFREMDKDGRIWWGENKNNVPAPKIYLSEVKQGRVPQTLWSYTDVGHTQEAKKELMSLVAFNTSDDVFDTPKPVRLIKQILKLSTSSEEEDIVLDFFAGSGTTAQAVMEANNADGGTRRFICVQLPEKTNDSQLPTIAEIGKTRIRRVIQNSQAEIGSKLKLDEEEFTTNLGFRVYKLARSNYKAWQDYSGENVEELETLFDSIETPLVDGWKTENVLSEVMLLQGFPLDSTITPESRFTDNRIQRVESDAINHRLFVCLDDTIADATIARIQLAAADIFVCLDSALSDQAKLTLSDRCTLRVI